MGQFIRFLTGALIGAFLGALLAALFTPSSGETLRIRITENAGRLKEEVLLAAQEKRGELQKELGDLRHNISIN